MNEGFMKRNNRNDTHPEYDFAPMKGAFEANTWRRIARAPISCFSIPRWLKPSQPTMP